MSWVSPVVGAEAAVLVDLPAGTLIAVCWEPSVSRRDLLTAAQNKAVVSVLGQSGVQTEMATDTPQLARAAVALYGVCINVNCVLCLPLLLLNPVSSRPTVTTSVIRGVITVYTAVDLSAGDTLSFTPWGTISTYKARHLIAGLARNDALTPSAELLAYQVVCTLFEQDRTAAIMCSKRNTDAVHVALYTSIDHILGLLGSIPLEDAPLLHAAVPSEPTAATIRDTLPWLPKSQITSSADVPYEHTLTASFSLFFCLLTLLPKLRKKKEHADILLLHAWIGRQILAQTYPFSSHAVAVYNSALELYTDPSTAPWIKKGNWESKIEEFLVFSKRSSEFVATVQPPQVYSRRGVR
jgi:hypothetical protein